MIDSRRAQFGIAAILMFVALTGCSTSTGAVADGSLQAFAADFARQVLAAFLF